jgi:hypothetical protein
LTTIDRREILEGLQMAALSEPDRLFLRLVVSGGILMGRKTIRPSVHPPNRVG